VEVAERWRRPPVGASGNFHECGHQYRPYDGSIDNDRDREANADKLEQRDSGGGKHNQHDSQNACR
jgi:hypothetical protein